MLLHSSRSCISTLRQEASSQTQRRPDSKEDESGLRPLLETFVLAELLKLATWNGGHFEFHHFRDRYDNEVDIVVENQDGYVVGIEVKGSATANSGDFSGLRKLADACGNRFALGLVLYDHDTIVPFGERLFAAPISTLWGD